MNKIIEIIVLKSRWLAIASIISAVIPLYYIQQIKIDNSIEVWLNHESSEYKTYRNFLDRYKSEEFIVIAADMDDPFSDKAIAAQQELAEELNNIEGIARVLDLPGICSIIWKDRQQWKKKALSSRFLTNLLLSTDGQTAGIIAWFQQFENPSQRRQTVEKVEKAVDRFAELGFKPHIAGTPLMNVELDRRSQKASALFLPIALGVSILALAFMLKSISGVIAPMCAVGVTTAWTIGFMAMTGRTMNMVTVVLPSLLFILSLSSGIHITSLFFTTYSKISDKNQTVREVLRELIRPIFLSSVTTSVGFASLMISDMKPVADFGLFASIGTLLSFIFNILIIPGLLSLLYARVTREKGKAKPHWSLQSGIITANNKWFVCTIFTILLAMCIFVSTKSTVESNILKFFPEDSKISQDYAFIGNKLTGFYTVELELEANKSNEPEVIKAAQRLTQQISSRNEVSCVIGPGNIAELSDSINMASSSMLDSGLSVELLKSMLGRYRLVNDNMVSLRLSILINAMASSDFYQLLDFINSETNEILSPRIHYNITGIVPLLNDVQKSLVNTQIRSFSLAVTIILMMIAIFMWSVRAALAAILPNLLPVFAMFTFMVLFKIPLDAATVMIASVAIGIAADDTIHFLSHYKQEKRTGLDSIEAITLTFSKIGRAIVYTSIVTAAGFSILSLAQFKPVAYFGILTAITMLSALAGDLFILPVCVCIFKLWDKK